MKSYVGHFIRSASSIYSAILHTWVYQTTEVPSRIHRSSLLVLLGLGVCSVIKAQVLPDCPKVVIDDIDLQCAIHLPGSVKDRLVASLMHREYEEKSDWIGDVEDRVGRAETDGWPDRENQGYLGFSVQARWKMLRREPGLPHVLVTIV